MMIDLGAPPSRVKHCTTKTLCTLHENTFGRSSSSVDLKRLAVSNWQNINNYQHPRYAIKILKKAIKMKCLRTEKQF